MSPWMAGDALVGAPEGAGEAIGPPPLELGTAAPPPPPEPPLPAFQAASLAAYWSLVSLAPKARSKPLPSSNAPLVVRLEMKASWTEEFFLAAILVQISDETH